VAAKPTTARKGKTPEALRDATASGKPKDRIGALKKLVDADPPAAAAIALAWLAEPMLDEESGELSIAAADASAKVGGADAIDRMIAIALAGTPEYVAIACRTGLKYARLGDTAVRIAAVLTEDAVRAHPEHACELLEVLEKRGELGDRARIEALCARAPDLVDEPTAAKIDGVARALLAHAG
jgi:hypothetical protein